MPTRTDLTITSTNHSDANKKVTNKINYVNPNITNQQAVTLANMFVDLTKDTYQSTTRTDTSNCDNDTRADYPITRMDWIDNSSGSTTTPQFTISDPVIDAKTNSFSGKQFQIRIQVPYISAPTALSSSDNWINLKMQYGFLSASSLPVNTWVISLYTTQETIATENFNVTLHFDGNAQYKRFDLTVAVNITEAGE